jgi:superfamily II DNA or RNA helicase
MLGVLPTGMGKTVTFAAMIDRYLGENPGATSLVVAHRSELITQAAETISSMCPSLNVGIETGDSRADNSCDVVVASIQSIGMESSTRLDWLSPSLVIIDEAHHAAARTYQNMIVRMGVLDENGSVLLGVTATPHRLDNKALFGRDKTIFQEMIYQVTLLEAVKSGWLVDLKGFRVKSEVDLSRVKVTAGDYNLDQLEGAVNTEPRNTLAVKSYSDVCPNAKAIVFCAGVDHAEAVAEAFRAGGYKSESVNGAMPRFKRNDIIERFRSGEIQILTNMDIATEGFDVPDIECVILLRPTQSWSLFTQMVGRGLRPLAGVIDPQASDSERRHMIRNSAKPVCTVIDIVDCTVDHSLMDLPDGSQGDPSLYGLLGLPAHIEAPAEMTIGQVAEQFFELPEAAQSLAFRRPTKLGDLTAKLTAINLLAELDVPNEANDAGAQFRWLKTSDFDYVVVFGNNRRAAMTLDVLGNWQLRMDSDRMSADFDLGEDLRDAFRHAEEIIANRWVGLSLARRDGRWATASPTSAQLSLLRRLNCPEDAIAQIRDRGHASNMITILQETKISD